MTGRPCYYVTVRKREKGKTMKWEVTYNLNGTYFDTRVEYFDTKEEADRFVWSCEMSDYGWANAPQLIEAK